MVVVELEATRNARVAWELAQAELASIKTRNDWGIDINITNFTLTQTQAMMEAAGAL